MTPDRDEAIYRLVAAALLIVLLILIAPAVGRWWECQQLAPVERFFTRGC